MGRTPSGYQYIPPATSSHRDYYGLVVDLRTGEATRFWSQRNSARKSGKRNELNGDTEVLTSDMIGRAYVDNDEVEQIMANQDSKRWFLHLQDVKEYTVTFIMAYDREAAQRCITNLHCISGSS